MPVIVIFDGLFVFDSSTFILRIAFICVKVRSHNSHQLLVSCISASGLPIVVSGTWRGEAQASILYHEYVEKVGCFHTWKQYLPIAEPKPSQKMYFRCPMMSDGPCCILSSHGPFVHQHLSCQQKPKSPEPSG